MQPLGPDHFTRLDVAELGPHVELVGQTETAGQNVSRAEPKREVRCIRAASGEHHRGTARDNEELTKAGKRCDERVNQTSAMIFELRVPAVRLKGKHRDRGQVCGACKRLAYRMDVSGSDLEGANRALDVLELQGWRLISFEVQVIGGSTEHKDMLGPEPFGRIIVTPEHTMATYIAKQARKGPPTNDVEAAALLSSMNAYTGRYRIEGDKFVMTVDGVTARLIAGQAFGARSPLECH